MRRLFLSAPRLVLLAAALGGLLSAETIVLEEIIVKVNGDVILRSDYDKVLQEVSAEVERKEELSAEQKRAEIDGRAKNVLRDLIDERLLVQRGKEVGLDVEPQVLRQRDELMKQFNLETIDDFEDWAAERTGMPVEDLLDRMRDQYLSQAVLGQEVGSRITVTTEEIDAYYEEHREEFVRKEGVRLSEIMISTEGKTGAELAEAEKRARDTHERVMRGELFDEMARRFSDAASKDAGGDIGIFRRGDLRKDLEDQVFDNNPGFVSELMELDGRGYLIVKVTERFREGLAEKEEVVDEIRNRLMNPKYGPAVREFLTFLRERGYIEIKPGYADLAAAAGQDTAWSDPARLAPVTTTREEVLEKDRRKRLLWMIPMGGRTGDQEKEKAKEKEQDSSLPAEVRTSSE